LGLSHEEEREAALFVFCIAIEIRCAQAVGIVRASPKSVKTKAYCLMFRRFRARHASPLRKFR